MNTRTINRLMAAVIQEQDVESAIRSLKKYHLNITRLPSTGGFLGRRSTTLLIGLSRDLEDSVMKKIILCVYSLN